LAEAPDRIAQGVFCAAIGVQEQDINVGVREKCTPPKTSKRYQGEVLGFSSRTDQLSPKPMQDLFD
jgi:hypothetical protein